MMPSWYEDIQRRKRRPVDLMSGTTPPFNPEEPAAIPQPWEMSPEARDIAMPPGPPRPQRPSMEQDMPPAQTEAQERLRGQVDELAAAERRRREMPGWRKALGGVLEGIGSGRRGGLSGIARAGGAALTGSGRVRQIEESLPAYDRAADNERQANRDAEGLALRRDNLRRQQQADEDRAEEKQLDRQARLRQTERDPTLEEIGPGRTYDQARHSSTPSEVVPGSRRYFAPVRREVQAADQKRAVTEAVQSTWQVVPQELRDIIPMERAPDATISNAIRLKELQQQRQKTADERKEQMALARQHREDMVRLIASLNPSANLARDKENRDRQVETLASGLIKRFPKYDDAIDAAKTDPDIPPELLYQVITRLDALRARQPKPFNFKNPFSPGVGASPKKDPLGIR